MTLEEIRQILDLLDEWVDSLGEDQLNEQCRKSGSDFFSFMKQRGVDAGYLATKITQATGHNPAVLWRVDDAVLLRGSIRAYESTVFNVTHGESVEDMMNNYWRKPIE